VSLKLNKAKAMDLLREEASKVSAGDIDESWIEKIERLSSLCKPRRSETHIAFLGTSILAKSMNASVDLLAIKPSRSGDNPNAYSARSFCHGVLVPSSAELGFSLGVSGREPLNNQPYFRMHRLDDETPIHAGSREAFDYMFALVRELDDLPNEQSAKVALRAFIAVRRRYQRRYSDYRRREITSDQLVAAIETLVKDKSEGGRRAQAAVAGLLDIFAGEARVESGRINDPSRNYPGDVCVRSSADASIWEKAFEVRDKPVKLSDIQIFARKCLSMGVLEAAVVMVSARQKQLDPAALSRWAESFGVGITLFIGWRELVEQTLFWAEMPKSMACTKASQSIHHRLIAVEASSEAVTLWFDLMDHMEQDSKPDQNV
jgi:hypothetical protein